RTTSSTIHRTNSPASTHFPYTTLFRSRDGIESPTRGESLSSKKKDNPNQGKCSCCNLLKKDRVNDLFGPVTNEYCEGCHCPKSRSEEHTSELQSRVELVCRLLLEKKNC